jgi:histidine triad (HIT) family protein
MKQASCVFCKIIAGELPAHIITETDDVLVIKDIAPQAPIHYLIIPKKHIENLLTLDAGNALLAGELLMITQKLASRSGVESFRLIANNGVDAHQTVPHLHFHFLAGRKMTDF